MFRDMTISDLCNTEDHICEDNIYELYNELYNEEHDVSYTRLRYIHLRYILVFILYLIYALLIIKFTKTSNDFCCFNLISVAFIVIATFIRSNYSQTEMCEFPRWCHEGVNDTIISNSYSYRMDKCPKYGSWLTSYYEDNINYPSNNDCDETIYGCCKVENSSCDTVIREGDSYSFYQILLERETSWHTSIEKIDEIGSNCPTIEEIIYEVSSNVFVINLHCEIILFVFLILFINTYLLFKLYCKNNRDKMMISQSDVENDGDGEYDEGDGEEEEINILKASS